MVNGVESCGEIEKTQTGYFLRANSINQIIMYIFMVGLFRMAANSWINTSITQSNTIKHNRPRKHSSIKQTGVMSVIVTRNLYRCPMIV